MRGSTSQNTSLQFREGLGRQPGKGLKASLKALAAELFLLTLVAIPVAITYLSFSGA